MPQYKLHYLDGRGSAELARLVFAAAGVNFEDIRYSREDWPNHKQSAKYNFLCSFVNSKSIFFFYIDFPFQQVPVLEVDGVFINQSRVIAAYVAKQHGLRYHFVYIFIFL